MVDVKEMQIILSRWKSAKRNAVFAHYPWMLANVDGHFHDIFTILLRCNAHVHDSLIVDVGAMHIGPRHKRLVKKHAQDINYNS